MIRPTARAWSTIARSSRGLRRQAAAAVEAAPNPASRHQVFTPDDGTVLYRQLDNFSLKHRVMFDWLDEVLGQH